jgi:filamentous hemagglutinin family protein
MSYKIPPRKQAQASRLPASVRLGVAAVAACFISAPVLSNGQIASVTRGTVTSNQVGNVLTVTNSPGAIINWRTFSIQAGETTHFAQTSASSTVLNRVLNDPTVIYGTLSSNGRVWLVNPAGIMVGPGGKVDVAAFVASTLNVADADFLAGRSVFINDGGAGSVINRGEIRTPAGGSVYLIGSNVTNEGIITTPKGETILAAGNTVSLIDSATPGVKVDITGAEGNATNLGTITAEAGRVGIAGVIVRNSGTVNASSVVSEGGRVFLKASQDAYVDGNGRIVTTGTKGGSVEVLGNRVAVTGNAEIDASGTGDTNAGGGRILVGGDYQGANPDIQNANITYFGPDATLKADAGKVGDGGTVIVWSDDTTRAYGSISARGGAAGGNGGLVETSGKRYLDTPGIRVNVGAARGKGGTWLLDPSEINIVGSGTSDVDYGGDPLEFSYGGNVGTLVDDDLNDALAYGGNVIVRTDGVGAGSGNINVTNATIDGNGTGTGFLTLAAYGGGGSSTTYGDIIISGSDISLDGAFRALAGWNGATSYNDTDVISGKGNITISASQIYSADTIDLHAGQDITLGQTGVGSNITSVHSNGLMKVSAKNLNLFGGSTTKFDISGMAGPAVILRSDTNQKIEIENQIWLRAGSANNTAVYGGSMNGGSVSIVSDGDQEISAKIIKVHAGQSGHDNNAEIKADGNQLITITGSGGLLEVKGGGDSNGTVYGGLGSFNNQARIEHGQYGGFGTGDQNIVVYGGGTIAVYGGSGTGALGHYGSECATATLNPELCRGSNNTAEIQNRVGQQTLNFASGGYLHVEGGGAGDQNWAGIENDGGDQIIAGLPDIMLKGGTGGRILVYGGDVFDFYNDAGIYNESNGDQIIYGGNITINGYGGSASYGGAGFSNESSDASTLTYIGATGDLVMLGGASNVASSYEVPGEATAAFINTEASTSTLKIEVGGNITLTAGPGYGGAVLIGSVGGGASTTIDIAAVGTISANSGPNSGVFIGNIAEPGFGGADVTIRSGGNMSFTGTDNAGVMIGSMNGGTNPTTVTLGSMRDVTLSRASVGSWNADADSIAVYGGYSVDGAGIATASPYGGNLSFTRTRIGSADGDAGIALYAAFNGSGGDITFSDGGGAYGASIDIEADKILTLNAASKGVRLQTTTGLMSITADNFSAIGGSGIRGPGDVNLIGQPIPFAGAGVSVIAGAGQTIDVADTLLLQAGSINNPNGSGTPYYGGSVTFSAVGNQDISAGTLRLTAGTAGHDNVVQITGQAAQDITVSARLELNGGSGGNNNYARIASLGAAGVQTIDATGADIVLNGGASGGASGLANYADITLGTSNTTGSQTVYAGSIAINGGGNASSYGGAGFGAGNGRNQSFFVTGDLTMTGGASNAGSSSAYIGSQTGGGTIDVQVGGVVTLNGGTGTYGGVMIGSIDDSLGATTVKLSAGKNIAATGGTGGVLLGVKIPGATGNIVDVRAGWDAAAVAPSGQVGNITLNGPVTIKTDAGGQVLVQASGGGITLGAGTMTQGGSISINADTALALNGAVQGEGEVVAYGAGISIGAAGSVSSNATGDAISLVSSTTFTNNYGGNPLSTPNGRWLVYAADPASVTKNGMTSNFRQYNTVSGETIGSSGNGFIYASAPGVLDVDTTLVSGTASNTFGTAPDAVFGHVIAAASAATADNEDLAAITGTPAFTPTITAATNVGPYTINYDSGLASAAGYTFAAGAGLAYTVNAVVLQIVTASLQGTTTKIYDGTNIATLAAGNFLLTGFVLGDSATVTKTTGIYDLGKNVGSGLSVSTTLAAGDFVAGGSTNLGNYTLPTSAQGNIGTITKASISTVTGITAASKVYNTTTNAALNTAGAGFTGMYGGDVLTVGTASGAFTDKHAGTGKTVNISGITLGGADAGNYTLATPTATTTANITKATISTVTGITAASRVYNATTNAALNYGGAVGFTGIYGGDALTVATASGAFADKNVGIGKTVNISGITLGGADAGNYNLTTPTATTIANISKATISAVTGITAASKVYDGNASATLNAAGAAFTGMYGGDVLTVATASGAFNNRHRGIGKQVNISGITLGGTDAGNYSLNSPTATAFADISQLASVTWLGGMGNWSNAAKWFGGALPDGDNVATVVIPAGSVVTYDSSVAPTTLDSLNSSGSLVMASGSLAVNTGLTTQTYQQTGGALNGTGSFTVTDGFSQTGGNITLTGAQPVSITQTSGDVVVSRLSNAGGSVTITANNRILRSSSNADGVNIVADSVNLTSVYGGSSGSLAISAFTEATSSLSATVNAGASYGGISIQNFGAQPGTISLTDNAANPANVSGGKASISFYNSGNLAVGAGTTFSNGVNNGDIAITSGGSLDYTGGLASTSGGILLGAKAGLTMSSGLSTAGLLQLTAGTTLDVDSSIGGSYVTLVAPTININDSVVDAVNDAILTGSVINIDSGDVSAANVLLRGPAFGTGNLTLTGGGHVNASGQLEFNLANITADGGFLKASSSSSNITGFISGNITLDNGAYIEAGDDISLSFSGGSSQISLSNGSYVISDSATMYEGTTYLNFLARSTGGILIDGRETTNSTAGGSGFFVLDTETPATTRPNGGLVITYANGVVVDPCASSPDLCKPPTAVDPIIDVVEADPCATAPDSAQCKAQKPGDDEDKEKDQFGDEQENGKKDEKSSQKKVAQCGV